MIKFVAEHSFKRTALFGVFLAGLLGICIFQVNALTSMVYSIGDQEELIEQLKEQSIFSRSLNLPSFSRVEMEELAKEMQLERVKEVSYLRVLGSTVATNQNQR